MIDDMVRVFGLREGRPLVARLTTPWPAGRAALASGAPLGSALLLESVAGGRLAAGGAVGRGTALEFGDAFAQGRDFAFERGILARERRGQTQHPLAPFPEGNDDRGCDGGWFEKVLQAGEGLVAGGEVLVPVGYRHGSSASTAITAASTARRSPGGKAS